MKVLQYKGPFKGGDKIEVAAKSGYKYVHVGIQIPNRQPIIHQARTEKSSFVVENSRTLSDSVILNDDWKLLSSSDNWLCNEKLVSADMKIETDDGRDLEYRISSSNVLEFDEIATTTWSITVMKDLPWGTIIDIVYTDSNTTL